MLTALVPRSLLYMLTLHRKKKYRNKCTATTIASTMNLNYNHFLFATSSVISKFPSTTFDFAVHLLFFALFRSFALDMLRAHFNRLHSVDDGSGGGGAIIRHRLATNLMNKKWWQIASKLEYDLMKLDWLV